VDNLVLGRTRNQVRLL